LSLLLATSRGTSIAAGFRLGSAIELTRSASENHRHCHSHHSNRPKQPHLRSHHE
jgi:hypothetical protein